MNYYLFAGDNYYPSGGRYDLRGTAKSLEEVINFFHTWVKSGDPTMGMCWAHICFGSELVVLTRANFDTYIPGKYFSNIVELLTKQHNLWEGSAEYAEPIAELNRLTRIAFLEE